MARVNHVKAFRGQQKCQYSEGKLPKCSASRADHDVVINGRKSLNHEFTQAPLQCEKCGEPIKVGQAYKYMTQKTGPRTSRKRNRHETCAEWRPSEATGSPVLQVLYGAQEAAADELGELMPPDTSDDAESVLDELKAILSTYAEGVREAGEMRTEAADNIEDGFGHETLQSEELRDEGQELEDHADDCESVEYDLDSFDTDVLEDTEFEDALAEWLDDQIEKVSDAMAGMPL